ncbi:hypothetical protein V8C43DRAFT_288591 [Trichoderma afarasin]
MLHCPWSAIQLGMAAHTVPVHGSMTKPNPKLNQTNPPNGDRVSTEKMEKAGETSPHGVQNHPHYPFCPFLKLLPSYYQESGSVCCSFFTRMVHCRLSRRCTMVNNFSTFSRVSNRHHKGDLPISLASAVQVSNSDGKLGVTCDTPQNASRPWLTTACCLVTRCEANCEAITRPRSSHPIAGSVVESPSGCAQGSVSCLSNSNAPWSGLNPHPPDQQLKLFSRLTANGPKAKFLL